MEEVVYVIIGAILCTNTSENTNVNKRKLINLIISSYIMYKIATALLTIKLQRTFSSNFCCAEIITNAPVTSRVLYARVLFVYHYCIYSRDIREVHDPIN